MVDWLNQNPNELTDNNVDPSTLDAGGVGWDQLWNSLYGDGTGDTTSGGGGFDPGYGGDYYDYFDG
jgi:hypothetical protein